MFTLICERTSAIQVVAVVAHAFGVVLHVDMFTSSDLLHFSGSLPYYPIWIRSRFLCWCLLYILWSLLQFLLGEFHIFLKLVPIIFQFGYGFQFLRLRIICPIRMFWAFDGQIAQTVFVKSLCFLNFCYCSILIETQNHHLWIVFTFFLMNFCPLLWRNLFRWFWFETWVDTAIFLYRIWNHDSLILNLIVIQWNFDNIVVLFQNRTVIFDSWVLARFNLQFNLIEFFLFFVVEIYILILIIVLILLFLVKLIILILLLIVVEAALEIWTFNTCVHLGWSVVRRFEMLLENFDSWVLFLFHRVEECAFLSSFMLIFGGICKLR